MKNKYEINGDITTIIIERQDGTLLKTVIDTEDLPRAESFPAWGSIWNKETESWYVIGTRINNKGKKSSVSLHRWILQEPKGLYVDHYNHDTLDNRKENLRIVTNSENQQNRKGATRRSKSGIRGVCWREDIQKWQAHLKVNGKKIHVGHFATIEEADKAVCSAREAHMPCYVPISEVT